MGEGQVAASIHLHPLVIINISDHATRSRVRNQGQFQRVIGALLGYQKGKELEVLNSFELVTKTASTEDDSAMSTTSNTLIDETYLQGKLTQFAEVFPNYEFLGWYSSGSGQVEGDESIHKQLMAFNESPICLVLDLVKAPVAKDLPITVYESEVRIVDDTPQIHFAEVEYKIATLEAERIAVDHVAHAASSTTSEKPGAASISQLSGTQEAVNMLHTRIRIILRYLEAVKQGQVPEDLNILRQIKGICSMLPSIDTQQFKLDLSHEYNDSLLMTYLTSVMQSITAADELTEAHNIAYERSAHSRFPFQSQSSEAEAGPFWF